MSTAHTLSGLVHREGYTDWEDLSEGYYKNATRR